MALPTKVRYLGRKYMQLGLSSYVSSLGSRCNVALRYLAGAGVGLLSCLALSLGSWLLDFGLQCLGACLLGRAV